jgi:hypothetical protein
VGGGVQAGLGVDLVVLVDLARELLHERDHVAVVDLVGEVVEAQLQDGAGVAVLGELGVVLAEAGLVLRLRFLVVELDDCFLLAVAAAQVGLEGGEGAALGGLEGGEVLRDGAVEFGDHVLILHQYFLELVARVVVELRRRGPTILVKSMKRIPLSCSSLKKLNSCLIFSWCGAFAVRAGWGGRYIGRRRTPPS